MSSVKEFVKNRSTPLALTQLRIDAILSYIIECSIELRNSGVTYSRSQVKTETKDKFEDHLKKRLVHDYLKKFRKKYLRVSPLEEILFECEPEMPYTYVDSGKEIEANDKIDIKINRIGLQKIWNSVEDNDIYFAIECKIIKSLSDNSYYINDIQKFCDRKHVHFRLPIEGMIAFKENKTLTSDTIVSNLNERLKKCATINTLKILSPKSLKTMVPNVYSSTHLRNFNRAKFDICHLYLDYSEIIHH